MKDKIILTDIDGVVLKWIDGFIRYMNSRGYESLREHVKHDDLGYRFGITDKQEMEEHIQIFNGGYWEFGTLPPEEDVVESVKYLHDELGYKFVGITSCSTNPITIALRKANLYNVFGDVFETVHFVDLSAAKNTHLADYDSTFWIEDKIVNAEAGLLYDHKCIIIDRLYNSNDKIDNRIKRCYSWVEIVEYIENNQ